MRQAIIWFNGDIYSPAGCEWYTRHFAADRTRYGKLHISYLLQTPTCQWCFVHICLWIVRCINIRTLTLLLLRYYYFLFRLLMATTLPCKRDKKRRSTLVTKWKDSYTKTSGQPLSWWSHLLITLLLLLMPFIILLQDLLNDEFYSAMRTVYRYLIRN